MSIAAAPDNGISDAELALHIFVIDPTLFGGIVLRGDGPVRDQMLDYARSALAARGPIAKIPANVDSERLLGGLDLAATLAAGHKVMRPGLIDNAAGGTVIVPMAERIDPSISAHIAQAIDGGRVSAVLLDDGLDGDDAPPAALIERTAFHCDVSALRDISHTPLRGSAVLPSEVKPLTDEQLHAIAATAVALGIGSARALIFAHAAARAHAALQGRKQGNADDVAAAVRLVLASRATRVPQDYLPPNPQDEPPGGDAGDDDQKPNVDNMDLDDIMLDAAAAAIPQNILDQIAQNRRATGKGQSGRSGQKQQSTRRGRPLGARPGIPGNGKRLALIDSLRAAAPWQAIRRQSAHPADTRRIHIRKADLRVRRYEQRSETLTIFAVDASGSAALSRLAEAKGAVELMLAQSYARRAQVALIAFRQTGAEVLLPPTRSLTRARRALGALAPDALHLQRAGCCIQTCPRARSSAIASRGNAVTCTRPSA
ncbi:MAG: VWA domain-containing protein [Sphingopyxis sp.]|nr:VWA domain-containing protein [Sphingopyxis sp.]